MRRTRSRRQRNVERRRARLLAGMPWEERLADALGAAAVERQRALVRWLDERS